MMLICIYDDCVNVYEKSNVSELKGEMEKRKV